MWEDNFDKFWILEIEIHLVGRNGVVCRVPAFQSDGPGSIAGGVGDLIFILELWVHSCVVSGDGPGIFLITDSGRPTLVYLPSVLVRNLLLPLQAFHIWVISPGGVSPILGEDK